MSIDPVAAVGGADLAALVDAELASLAADAQALRDLLVEGSVLTATILPSNGLTDLIKILGLRVPAALPPNVRPGDVVQVRVTGFDGDQVQVQLLGPAVAETAAEPPHAPAPLAQAAPAAAPQPSAGAAVVIPRGGNGAAYGAGIVRAASPPPAAAPTPVEARLAAQAASAPRVTPAVSPPPPVAARIGGTPVAPRPAPSFVAPPQVAPRSPVLPAAPPAPRAAGLAGYHEPVALLRALRLPVTPSTVASATLALARPERLPQALATLERALPATSGDPHVATLRTLLAFVGRIEPESPVLAAQISAYVDHVVDGAEPKLATLLAATDAVRAARTAPASSLPASPPSVSSPPAAALAVERSAALNVDLKQTMLAVAADPSTPPAASDALAGALSALTAVQTDAARLLAAQPDGLAFTIPLVTQFGPRDARIRVAREAPQQRGVPLDGENFRVSFVLDTANVGTVAIDLVTVGREVTVDVRAENAAATRAFRDALGTLTARLESLRYRVASAEAKLGTPAIVERVP